MDSLPDNYFPSNPPPFPNSNLSPELLKPESFPRDNGLPWLGTTPPFPGSIDDGYSHVETFPGADCLDLFPPFFESSNNGGDIITPSPALEDNPYHPDAVEQRIRPPYRANPAHDPRSPLFNPTKTPEPTDASLVYENAVRANMGTWFGTNQNGEIYRFFSDNAGGVHFSGKVPPQIVPNNVKKELQIRGK